MLRDSLRFLIRPLLPAFLSNTVCLEGLEELILLLALSLTRVNVIIGCANEVVIEELLEITVHYLIEHDLSLVLMIIVIWSKHWAIERLILPEIQLPGEVQMDYFLLSLILFNLLDTFNIVSDLSLVYVRVLHFILIVILLVHLYLKIQQLCFGFLNILRAKVHWAIYLIEAIKNHLPKVRADLYTECLFYAALDGSLIRAHSISLETLEDPLDALQSHELESHADKGEVFDAAEAAYRHYNVATLLSLEKKLFSLKLVHAELTLHKPNDLMVIYH